MIVSGIKESRYEILCILIDCICIEKKAAFSYIFMFERIQYADVSGRGESRNDSIGKKSVV